ncbi:DUF2378 family protein [Archangium lansingense]|uniref:DUF2378 family protein n=1 Tax=Archangium lansingense TaxID=2995310 RepID=A0ABT4AEH2_9BACT|nr:DUF2378 family protein [Archangium lansinium]MCY1080086.1 DUF2378 family protein [Archangium lansinium]
MMSAAATRKEPVIFSQVVEAVFKHAIKGRLDSHTRARLKKIGIDLDHPFLVAYSVPTWFAAVGVCSEVLFPDIPNEQARYRIGRLLVDGYGQTTMGRAVFAMLRMLGWERSLGRISRGLQSGTNYMAARTRFLDDGTLEVTFEVMPEFHAALGTMSGIDPHFMHGNMDAMMELVGAPFHSGELLPVEPGSQRVVYLLRRKS